MRDKRSICGALLFSSCFSLMMVTGEKVNVAAGSFSRLPQLIFFKVYSILQQVKSYFQFYFLLSTDKTEKNKVLNEKSAHFKLKRFSGYSLKIFP